MTYSAPAQAYTSELTRPKPTREMQAEEHVLALRSRVKDERANALEFLNRPISRIAPRQKQLPLSPTIECSNCGQEKPPEDFRDHPNKSNGKQSQCRDCENRCRVIRYHRGKSVRLNEIVVKSRAKQKKCAMLAEEDTKSACVPPVAAGTFSFLNPDSEPVLNQTSPELGNAR